MRKGGRWGVREGGKEGGRGRVRKGRRGEGGRKILLMLYTKIPIVDILDMTFCVSVAIETVQSVQWRWIQKGLRSFLHALHHGLCASPRSSGASYDGLPAG